MKYFLMLCLICGLLPAYAQDHSEMVAQSTEIFKKISGEKDLDKKIQIFNEIDNKVFFKQFPTGEAGAAYPIAEQYIKLGDKKNAVVWMNLTKRISRLNESLLSDFYTTFQRLGEHQFIIDYVAKEMDSLYQILESHSDKNGTVLNFYSARLPYYMESKIALKQYDDACKHMDMVYKYRGNTFANNRVYFQYADVLLANGRGDQAIEMFARYMAEKTNFSPKIEQTQKMLISKVPNGEAKFKTALTNSETFHKNNYQALIGSLKELNGVDLKEKLGKSKYILLSFWGSWCAPCLKSHPKLLEIYEEYKQHGLEVLGIAQENGSDIAKAESVLRESIETQKLPWLQTMLPLKWDPSHPLSKFMVSAYPTKILVDREGKVLIRFSGADFENITNLKQILADVLADEASKVNKVKIESANKVYNEFLKAATLAQKEQVYKNFIAKEALNLPEISALQDQMARALSLLQAKAKNIELATKYHKQIKDESAKASAALELVEFMSSGTEKAAYLEPLMNAIPKNVVDYIESEHINRYNSLVKPYVLYLPKTGAEDKKIEYLEVLYNSSDKSFITDAHQRKGVSNLGLENTLTYVYAKALGHKGRYDDAAKVLISYLNADSNYLAVKSKMLVDFKEIPNLLSKIEANKPTGDEIYAQLATKLILKKDIKGKIHGIRAINKYFLVDFWGSWCIPCRIGNPHLIKLYNKYQDSGFEIIGLAYEGTEKDDLETKLKRWKSAVFEDDLPWIQLINDDREGAGFDAVKAFRVNSFPTKILFDKDKKVIGIYSGGDDEKLDAKLKEIFGK